MFVMYPCETKTPSLDKSTKEQDLGDWQKKQRGLVPAKLKVRVRFSSE